MKMDGEIEAAKEAGDPLKARALKIEFGEQFWSQTAFECTEELDEGEDERGHEEVSSEVHRGDLRNDEVDVESLWQVQPEIKNKFL